MKLKLLNRKRNTKRVQSFIRQLISANHISINIKKYGAYQITESD